MFCSAWSFYCWRMAILFAKRQVVWESFTGFLSILGLRGKTVRTGRCRYEKRDWNTAAKLRTIEGIQASLVPVTGKKKKEKKKREIYLQKRIISKRILHSDDIKLKPFFLLFVSLWIISLGTLNVSNWQQLILYFENNVILILQIQVNSN